VFPDSPSDNFASQRDNAQNELLVLEEEKAASPINRMYLKNMSGGYIAGETSPKASSLFDS